MRLAFAAAVVLSVGCIPNYTEVGTFDASTRVARAWTVAAPISPGSVRWLTGFSVGDRGQAMVGWIGLKAGGAPDGLVAYEPGAGWGAPIPLPVVSPGTTNAGPIVSLGKSADFVAWASEGVLRVSRRAGGAWTTHTIGTGAGELALASSDDGHAHVVWKHFNGNENRVSRESFAPGSGWGPEEAVDMAQENVTPEVVASANGAAYASWGSYSSGRGGSYAAAFAPSTGWAAPTEFSGTATTLNHRGDAISILRAPLRSTRFGAADWSGVDEVPGFEAGEATYPSLALNADRTAMLGFGHRNIEFTNVFRAYASIFRSDAGWSTPTDLTGELLNDSSRVHVAIDSVGNGIAAWVQHGPRQTLWTRTYEPSTGWSPAEQRDLNVEGGAESVFLAIDSFDNAVLVWREEGGGRRVWAAHYR